MSILRARHISWGGCGRARAKRKRVRRSSTIPHGCKIPSVFLWSPLLSLARAHSTRRTTPRCSVQSAIQRLIAGDERSCGGWSGGELTVKSKRRERSSKLTIFFW